MALNYIMARIAHASGYLAMVSLGEFIIKKSYIDAKFDNNWIKKW